MNETLFLEGDFLDEFYSKIFIFQNWSLFNNDCNEEIDSLIDRIKLVFYIQINFPE